MDRFYKTLGISEKASKSWVKIAYLTALDHAQKQRLGQEKELEIHIAYQVLRKYRTRLRRWTVKGHSVEQDGQVQEMITEAKKNVAQGKWAADSLPPRFWLEIKYAVRTMVFGIFGLLLSMAFEFIEDLLTIAADGRVFLSSLLFYAGLFNHWIGFLPPLFTALFFVASFLCVVWMIWSQKRRVMKAVESPQGRVGEELIQ